MPGQENKGSSVSLAHIPAPDALSPVFLFALCNAVTLWIYAVFILHRLLFPHIPVWQDSLPPLLSRLPRVPQSQLKWMKTLLEWPEVVVVMLDRKRCCRLSTQKITCTETWCQSVIWARSQTGCSLCEHGHQVGDRHSSLSRIMNSVDDCTFYPSWKQFK